MVIGDAEDESDNDFEKLPLPEGALTVFAFILVIASKLIYNGYWGCGRQI